MIKVQTDRLVPNLTEVNPGVDESFTQFTVESTILHTFVKAVHPNQVLAVTFGRRRDYEMRAATLVAEQVGMPLKVVSAERSVEDFAGYG